jgi:outer membrane protein assembly factor BamB
MFVRGMIMNRIPLLIAPFFVAFLLASCSSATISNQLRIDAVGPEYPAPPGISDRSLIGGGGNDWARKVICSAEGPCAIFGYEIKSFTESTDFLMAMESKNHQLLWGKTFGGTHKDELRSAFVTSDGGYLLWGNSQSLFFTAMKVISPNRPPRPFLVKVDKSGTVQWAETIERKVSYLLEGLESTKGNYIFVGTLLGSEQEANSGIITISFAPDGKLVWAFRYDVDKYNYGYALAETSGGGFLLAGYIREDVSTPAELLLAEIDSQGKALWGKLYKAQERLVPLSLVRDVSGGYVITGVAEDSNGRKNSFVIKLSSTGKILWAHSYKRQDGIEFLSLIVGHQGDFLAVGRSGNVKEGEQDGCAVLIDANGIIKAATLIGGPANDELVSASKLGQRKYRLVGDTESFNAKYVDILSVDWDPYDPSSQGTQAGITTNEIKMTEKVIQTKQMNAPLEIQPIPASLLELQTLSVLEQGKK